MNALGTHLLIELRECAPDRLNDVGLIRSTMIDAANDLGVTILSHSFHKFAPQGVTGIIAISESHFSIHTWPEYGYAALDIFTCGEAFDPTRAARHIAKHMGAERTEITVVERGRMPAVVVTSG